MSNSISFGTLYIPSQGNYQICSAGPTTSGSGRSWYNLQNLAIDDSSYAYSQQMTAGSSSQIVNTRFSFNFVTLTNATVTSISISMQCTMIGWNLISFSSIGLQGPTFTSGSTSVSASSYSCNIGANQSPNCILTPQSIPWSVPSIYSSFSYSFYVTCGSNLDFLAQPQFVVYNVKSNLGYVFDTSVTSINPTYKISQDGGGFVLNVLGINFINAFSTSPNAIQVRIGNKVVNSTATIVSQGLINITLPVGQSFDLGNNIVSISLNAGVNWTTENVIFTVFGASCPGNDCNGRGTCNSGVCTCNPGWLSSATGCVTFDNTTCGNGTDPCNHGTCVDYQTCKCNPGYVGSFCNTSSCIDLNNCNGNGICIGPDECKCSGGWKGDSCTVPDCSAVINCIPNTCVAPNNCTCSSGWIGDSCNIFVCDVVGCGDFGTCSGPNQCTCNKGYSGSTCSQFDCGDNNNCTSSVNGYCTGPETCTCNSGYTGNDCSNITCSSLNNCNSHGNCVGPNNCSCIQGYQGTACDLFDCSSLNNCNGNGTCNGPSQCLCNPGYNGSTDCLVYDCVSANNCNGNGTCIGPNVCNCTNGYTGATCSQFSCSQNNNCSGNGTCIAPNTCSCNVGYGGSNCSEFGCSQRNNCNERGTCTGPNTCSCNYGYYGPNCENFDCRPLSNCSNNLNGVCVSPFTCKCFSGYVGSDCSKFDCSLKNNCTSNGNCTSINTCTCFSGFKGDTCSIRDCSVVSCSSNKSLAIGLGLGLGLGFLFLLIILVFLLLLFKKKTKEDDPNIKKPDFQMIVFPPGYKKQYETDGKENDLKLLKEELLKHLGLINLFTPYTNNKECIESVPRALAYIFHGDQLAVDVFENWLTIELVNSKSKGTLFRLSTCSTSYFTHFLKLNCLHYLWWVNATLIHSIIQRSNQSDKVSSSSKNSNFEEDQINMDNFANTTELNPEHLGEVDELYIKANSYQLLLYLTQLERRIVNSLGIMPSDLRRMLRHIHKQVGTKYDIDAQMSSVGGFLILRAINPSLCTPNVYGVTQEKISSTAQKELMNISRILQNLSNETPPSDKNKFLVVFDDFVEQEIPKIRDFYREVIGIEAQQTNSKSVVKVPQEAEMDSLAVIWNLIHKNKDQIQNNDEDGEFKDILQRIDKPINKK